MRSNAPFAVVLALGLLTGRASADVPVPNQELCTVKLQQRDGSHCESCTTSIRDPPGTPNPCEALEARGLHRRCSFGATVSRSVYCDAEGDFVEVGGGSGGCGCRVGAGGGSRGGWILIALGAMGLRRSRRRHRRARG